MDIVEVMGIRAASLAHQNNLTVSDLSGILGRSEEWVQLLLAGEVTASYSQFCRLVDALGTTDVRFLTDCLDYRSFD